MLHYTRRGLLAIGLTALCAASVALAAPKKLLPVEGIYEGSSLSVEAGAAEVPITLELTPGKNRKVTGLLTVNTLPAVQYELVGTVSASGQLSLQAKQPGGANFKLKGKFTDAVTSTDPMVPAEPKTIAGTYQLTRGGDRGSFTVTAAP